MQCETKPNSQRTKRCPFRSVNRHDRCESTLRTMTVVMQGFPGCTNKEYKECKAETLALDRLQDTACFWKNSPITPHITHQNEGSLHIQSSDMIISGISASFLSLLLIQRILQYVSCSWRSNLVAYQLADPDNYFNTLEEPIGDYLLI